MAVVFPVKSNHPTYADMAVEAIKELNDKKGSSRIAIYNYIVKKYQLDKSHRVNSLLNKGIVGAVDKGILVRKSGIGATGRFRIPSKQSKPHVNEVTNADEEPTSPKVVKTKSVKKPKKALLVAKSPKRTSIGNVPDALVKAPTKEATKRTKRVSGTSSSKVSENPAKVVKKSAKEARAPVKKTIAKKPAPKKTTAKSS